MTIDYHSQRKYTLLNIIWHLGPISRKKLIQLTDYRPASVTELTKELIDGGLVVERGSVSNGPGRKRTLLELNSSRICAIGVLLTYTKVTYVLSQINGTVVERIDSEINDPTDDQLAELTISRITALLHSHPDKKIVGIGLADPLYDEERFGFTASLSRTYENFIDWGHMKLKPRLEKLTGIPVRTFSAAVLPVLVEQHYGAAKGKQDFICVELSNGLGVSMIAGGKPVTGFQGRAGELGHTTINFGLEDRTMCYCGKTGCVEADAAFPYVRKNICAALQSGTYSSLLSFYDPAKPLTVKDVRRGLDEGDILCEHYVRESARRIGAAIANVVNILNPEMIVLFGSMTGLGDFFIEEIKSILRRNTLVLLRGYQVAVNPSLESLLPLGAAAEMFNEFLKTDDFNWVYRLQREPEAENDEEEDEEA